MKKITYYVVLIIIISVVIIIGFILKSIFWDIKKDICPFEKIYTPYGECIATQPCEDNTCKSILPRTAYLHQHPPKIEGGDTKVVEKIVARFKIKNNLSLEKGAGSLEIPLATELKATNLWSITFNLLPPSIREYVKYFIITSDGGGNGTAYVSLDSHGSIDKWSLAIDSDEVYNTKDQPLDIMYWQYMITSIIHEIGHILILSQSLDVDWEKNKRYDSTQNCQTFYTKGGCMENDSIFMEYYRQFWEKSELKEYKTQESTKSFKREIYNKYPDNFITIYATSGAEEDMAESWTAFILRENPTGNTIVDEKIRFFYRFPEFVKIRTVLRDKITFMLSSIETEGL